MSERRAFARGHKRNLPVLHSETPRPPRHSILRSAQEGQSNHVPPPLPPHSHGFLDLAAPDVPPHGPFRGGGVAEQLRSCADVRVLRDFLDGAGVCEVCVVEEAFDQSSVGSVHPGDIGSLLPTEADSMSNSCILPLLLHDLYRLLLHPLHEVLLPELQSAEE